MRKSLAFGIALLAGTVFACSSKNTGDDDDYGNGLTGGAPQYPVTGGSNAALSNGGANQLQGGAGNVGGGIATGGRAVAGNGALGTGGSTTCGQAACSANMCGLIVDFCGNEVDCGMCPVGSVCGLTAATANQCTACSAKTCASVGADCGYLSDGCGGLLDCGTCQAPMQCGIGADNKCGDPAPGTASGNPCADPTAGFCPQVADCKAAGSDTTITGTVLAPNGTLPLPNALVYVPNGSTTSPYGVKPFVDGVANGACECNISGTPLVSTTSGVDGSFTLTGVPVGKDIPLVIQLGRWRRLVTIPSVNSCAVNAIPATLTSLPSRQAMASPVDAIPLMALATGAVDAMECVLRKMGIEDTQFTNPWDTGRIRMYRDNGAWLDWTNKCTAVTDAQGKTTYPNCVTPSITDLTSTQANVDQYDAVIFPCKGAAHDVPGADKSRVLDAATSTTAYVNKGGRAFFTHFSYGWLYNQQPSINLSWRSTTDVRAVDNPSSTTHHDGDAAAEIDMTFARGLTFATWLSLPAVNALSNINPPQINVRESRWDMFDLQSWAPAPYNTTWNNAGPAQRWAYYPYQNQWNQNAVMHVTFDTPWAYPPDKQCGRVLYSDFHVTNAAIEGRPCITGATGSPQTSNCVFPGECNGDFTAQEKTLAYFMFDMTSCVRPPALTCKPKTCADLGPNVCGPQGDGCGNRLDCGPCCVPRTCDEICSDPAAGCSNTKGGAYLLDCKQPDQCNSTVTCYCKVG